MLLILYGAGAELGKSCRDYLQNMGYELVDKYSYIDEERPLHESRFGQRIYLSKEDFYAKTDSLFRYNVANVQVGFSWDHISDALYENKNKLLTCASADISMLRKIKDVYKEKAYIIYCYVDAAALEGLYVNLPGMSAEEYGSRMAMGLSIKECYSKNVDLFDSVIVYGGEGSVFNYKTIYQQLDAIVEKLKNPEESVYEKYDIFLSYCVKDINEKRKNNQYCFVKELVASLNYYSINVFQNSVGALSDDNIDEPTKIEGFIHKTKVFVPVFSEDALNSKYFLDELNVAISTSKNNGVIILPISLDGAVLPEWMNEYSAYNVQSECYQGSINFIEDWFIDMFSGEDTLRNLSEKIDTYVKTGLYKKAYELQGSYVNVLHNHLSKWHRKGTVEKCNAWIKYLNLSVQIEDFNHGSEIINSLLSEITDELDVNFYNNIARCIVNYCNVSNTAADSMYDRFYKFLHVSSLNQQKFFEIFNILYGLAECKPNDNNEETVDVTLADKIAAYSNASVELFEALFENGMAQGYREALISAYNRIIDYCKTVSLGSPIAEKCLDRVSELKATHITKVDETESGKKTLQSLKVYLGQALPDTGNYDVFISHKSADDMIADKVFDFLRNCGFEVFCDHHTLGELRDSNYDKRVMEALGKSKHLILVASSPDYVKDGWVHDEWHHFHSDKRDKYRNGNLIMILSDDLLPRKSELPIELRDGYEIIKTSEFRDKINNYLW